MILGMSLYSFTLLHVAISLVGIATGFVVLYGMLTGRKLEGWTAIFLITTILTSVTGFMFPIARIGPPHIFGAISLVVLAVTLLSLYVYRLEGSWRWIYVVTALFAQYLNVFVGVVQAFQKSAALAELAPTQSEPPFLIAQAAVLGLFLLLGWMAVARFRPAQAAAA